MSETRQNFQLPCTLASDSINEIMTELQFNLRLTLNKALPAELSLSTVWQRIELGLVS